MLSYEMLERDFCNVNISAVLKEFSRPVFSCEKNPYLGPGVMGMGNGPQRIDDASCWRRQNQHDKIFYGALALL